jgi:2-succinyl-6-hydroxy-2,4-cyclohexadiene-1-carboxylate synthase
MSNAVERETRLLEVNGIHLHALLCGAASPGGTTLVLLHGFTGSATGWGDLLDDFAATGMRVIAFDLHGHGHSDAPHAARRYAMEHCQADIIAALRLLGIERGEASLLGYSMGGRIALYCAFSGYFRALILESASPGISDAQEREQRRLSDMALAESIEREGVAAFVEYWEWLPLFASQHNLPASKRTALHEQRLNNRTEGLANSLRGVGTGVQSALHARLPELDIPVLLIAGDLDEKFCEIAREMASLLPRARLRIVAGAGHTVHLEQPGIFIDLVREFCHAEPPHGPDNER